VAVLVSVLVGVAARRTADATRASSEAAALGRIASAILTTRDPLPRLLHDLRVVFGLDAVAILRPSGDAWEVEYAAGDPVPRRPADAAEALSVGSGRYLVLSGDRVPAEDSRVLAAFAAQLALAVGQRTGVGRS
jgi:two-component system sensor histidine kinase KdpD